VTQLSFDTVPLRHTRPSGGGASGPVVPDGTPAEPAPHEPEVEVRVSPRRRKSAVGYWEGDRIVVVLPAHLSGRRRTEMIDWLVDRTRARRPGHGSSDEQLARRAAVLADRYVDGVRPSSIRWVTNQKRRWGSCTVDTREIRLSHRLQSVPGWVLDAVIVHELTHLLHAGHSPMFYEIANRFPRQLDASLFLDGFAHGTEVRDRERDGAGR
jgi:hypothetical protein